MNPTLTRPEDIARAPEAFRDALAELVGIGMSVARMVGRAAETETAMAEAAAQAGVADDVPAVATSLAEAIEQDKAFAAAGEARLAVVARTETVAGAFAQVSRAVRRTVLLAERLDRGWARAGCVDDRFAMARREIERGVAEAIGRAAEGERADALSEAAAERLEMVEVAEGIGRRPADVIVREICAALGVEAREELPVGRFGPLPSAWPGNASEALPRFVGTPPPGPLPQGAGEKRPSAPPDGEELVRPCSWRPPRDRRFPHR